MSGVLHLIFSFYICVVALSSAEKSYCKPGEECWPSDGDVNAFMASLLGDVILPGQANYANVTGLMNLRFTRRPQIVAMVKSEEDVQKSVIFATKYNIRISILGTGHDFIGRSTANDSLMINTRNMKNITIHNNITHSDGYNGPAGIMAIGNQWGGVYKEVDKYGYIIAGGSSPTVGMGGYTSGGGHSPMTRILGLAVDNVLEFTIVLANGRIARVMKSSIHFTDEFGNTSSSNDAGLFWAVRGGGGSTFGVLTSIMFKLHKPPTAFVHMGCSYAWYSRTFNVFFGPKILKNYFDVIPDLAKEWGGYILFNSFYNAQYNIVGTISLSMLYAGHSYEHAMESIGPLKDFYPGYNITCTITNHTSFWSYEKNVYDAVYLDTYITNILLPKKYDSEALVNVLSKHMMPTNPTTESGVLTCTGTLIGGRSEDFKNDSASASTYLRHGLSSLSCGTGWQKKDENYKDYLIGQVQKLQVGLRPAFGKGVYYNEPPYYLDDWKTAYWGDNYPRLQKTKIMYDPQGTFTCYHCVEPKEVSTQITASAGHGISACCAYVMLLSLVGKVIHAA